MMGCANCHLYNKMSRKDITEIDTIPMSEPIPNATELVEMRTPSPPDDPPQVKSSIIAQLVHYKFLWEWEIPTIPRVDCFSPNWVGALD
jgi:hypothetical protein